METQNIDILGGVDLQIPTGMRSIIRSYFSAPSKNFIGDIAIVNNMENSFNLGHLGTNFDKRAL